mmetsp:Transcript_22082/g.61891  ORF Transcript_22082/g.61891 Transcript_22082/m.61891 type:complete len:207 (-) Transcript_22082:87-707(-)
MGKYNKRMVVPRTKATTVSDKMLKKHRKKSAARVKARTRAAKRQEGEVAAKVAGKSMKVRDIDAEMPLDSSASMPAGARAAAEKLVSTLERAKTERKAEDALKKAIAARPGADAFAAAVGHCAGRGFAGCVRALLEAGAPANGLGASGGSPTPLQAAAGRGHVEVVRLLVAAGADRTGAPEAAQALSTLGAVFTEERKVIQALLSS